MNFDGKITVSILKRALHQYDVAILGKGWDINSVNAAYFGVTLVGEKFASVRESGKSSSQAFKSIYQEGVNLFWGTDDKMGEGCKGVTGGGCTTSRSHINFWSMAGQSGNDWRRMSGNVIHELGHAYNFQLGQAPEAAMLDVMVENRNLILEPNSRAPILGACDDCEYWQYNRAGSASETFADMFVAWTYGVWNTSNDIKNVAAVSAAKLWATPWLP